MTFSTVTAAPLPAFAVMVLPQFEVVMESMPDMFMPFAFGLWVMVVYLDKINRLPGARSGSKSRVAFDRKDSERIKGTHELLSHREDDGPERIVHHGKLLERMASDSQKFDRTVGLLVEQLRVTSQRLENIERHQGREDAS